MEKEQFEKLLKEYQSSNPKENWLKEHIAEILALFIGVAMVTIFWFVLTKETKTNESTTITILTSITNLFIMVVSYYFGSSKGSKDKEERIKELQAEK